MLLADTSTYHVTHGKYIRYDMLHMLRYDVYVNATVCILCSDWHTLEQCDYMLQLGYCYALHMFADVLHHM